MKRLPMPTACPVTGGPLMVTRLECEESGVVIEGRFTPNEFALLANEHLEFLRIFVKVRGNLKEAERVLGISYPTVRLRFDKLLLALGYEVGPDVLEERSTILDQLEAGDIGAEEASKRLQALAKKG
ncbi:MAG: DUF2089 domain-containing protein [Trueperaceae bacterium]|nr:DUF2089 domain-containing protein [Trueperaceae bacterium]